MRKQFSGYLSILLLIIMAFSFVPVTTAYAWNWDEAYEHNRRVRARWTEVEMCDDLRTSYLLPSINTADFFIPSARNYVTSEFPDEIIYTANNIIEELYDDFEKARAIANWVSRNISYGVENYILPGTRHHSDAPNVLHSRTGVCTGFSNLTVALLRSAGIPAKRVNGSTWDEWDRGLEMLGHAWVEAYIDDRWIIIDPTWMTANRTRYFDISLIEISRSHRYEDRFILVPHNINGLIFDSRTNHLFDLAIDTSIITEFVVPEAATVLHSVISLTSDTPYLFPNLERLVLPDGLINISGHLFGHSNLHDVVLPESLEIIGDFAFQETNLSEIALPNSLERIGNYAFAYTNLSNVVLPENLNSLGISAFANTDLGSIVIPSSLERINVGSFYNANLYSAFIPSSTTTINDGAFDENPYLTIFGNVGSAAEAFASNAGIPFVGVDRFEIVDDFAMDGSVLLFPMFGREDVAELVIPDGITEITKNAFRNFTYLTEVIIPESVISIGSGAFAECSELDAVFVPYGVTYIGSGAFEPGVVIYGNYGSIAEEFASENGNVFINATALGEPIIEAIEDVEAVTDVAVSEQNFSMLFVIGGGVLVASAVVLIVVKSKRRV